MKKGKETGTHLFLPVYTPVDRLYREILLTRCSYATGLSCGKVVKSGNDRLLFLSS